MLDREIANDYIDYLLTQKPNSIVDVPSNKKTIIGSCDSDMRLYIFNFENTCEDEYRHSVIIADSENHGIQVFIVMGLTDGNLFEETWKEGMNQESKLASIASPNHVIFPKGDELDFQNALRIVDAVRIVTWN